MNENENRREPEFQEEFDLEDILREFSDSVEPLGEPSAEEPVPEEAVPEVTADFGDTIVLEEIPVAEETPQPELSGDTVRINLPKGKTEPDPTADTIRVPVEEITAGEEPKPAEAGEEAFAGQWQPEYEQPMGEYVPPQPILFHPRSKLRELKRKLVAGPERRYYELTELGYGKLQAAMFLCFLLVILSAGTTALYAMGMVAAERLKLMVFCQLFALLFSALLASYQLIEGVTDIFRGRFSPCTMLVFTFLACCADGFLCLKEQRIPCCAPFSLQAFMCLWGVYHKRSSEMGMMDTLRKATTLTGIKSVPNYYDGSRGFLRGEAQPEDFMDSYRKRSTPEKVISWYCLAAFLLSVGIGVLAWQKHDSLSFGLQALSVSLLAAMPVTTFITLSRPAAILQRRLHRLGTVLCGWRGIVGLCGRAVFPVTNEDLFPVGSCKLNGVKFYGSRDPDQVVAYCAALVNADGGGLVPLFEHLLTGRGGRHYTAHNVRGYAGGIGGEVCGVSVLMGNVNCLKELGVEIPSGTSVSQAVYAAIDGEFCGVFAVTYARTRSAASGMRTLCAYRGLRPALVAGEFMLTEEFLHSRFNINIRKVCFPQRTVRQELAQVEPDPREPALAIITSKGLAPYAFAITGARSLRSACWIGVAVHLLGGILGLAIMAMLTWVGARELLTPHNVFLFELVWLIPGIAATEWARAV